MAAINHDNITSISLLRFMVLQIPRQEEICAKPFCIMNIFASSSAKNRDFLHIFINIAAVSDNGHFQFFPDIADRFFS